MLEITRIRTEKEQLIEALKKRNIDVTDTMNQIIEKDQQSGRPEHICYCAAGRESRPRFDLITTFIYFFVTISVNEVTFIEDEK